MIVRFSKYDFLIPGEISRRHSKNSIKKYIFSRSKKIVEKVGFFFRDQKLSEQKKSMKKSMKIENFEISKNNRKIEILKFSFFIDFSEDFFSENFLVSKNIFSTFSRFFFDLECFYLCMDFFLYQSEIFSGIQKSYLENRASILKLFKIKNQLFWHRFPDFRTLAYSVTYTDP